MIQGFFSVEVCHTYANIFIFPFQCERGIFERKINLVLIKHGSLQQDYCLMSIRMFHFPSKLSGRVSAETAIFEMKTSMYYMCKYIYL